MRNEFVRALSPDVFFFLMTTAPGANYGQSYRLATNFISAKILARSNAMGLESQNENLNKQQVFA